MGEPILAVQLPGGRGRAYKHPVTGDFHISVTNVIDVLAKPWLGGWTAKLVAGYAFDNRKALMEMEEREAAVDFLKGAPRRKRDSAAGIGSVIHEYVECMALSEPRPKLEDVHKSYIAGLEAFVEEFQPSFEAVECTVFSQSEPEDLQWAGTFDVLMLIPTPDEDLLFLVDWKTGSGIYDEVALQLAALRRGESMWDKLTGDLSRMPKVAGCLAIHLQPNAFAVHVIDAGDMAYRAFLGLRAAWPWTKAGVSPVGPKMNRTRLVREFSSGAAVDGAGDGLVATAPDPVVAHGGRDAPGASAPVEGSPAVETEGEPVTPVGGPQQDASATGSGSPVRVRGDGSPAGDQAVLG